MRSNNVSLQWHYNFVFFLNPTIGNGFFAQFYNYDTKDNNINIICA